MKYKKIILSIFICLVMLFVGCTQENQKETLCVKCGAVATTTLSGPADIMAKYGISTNKCTQITTSVYSAPVCDTCVTNMGPVVENPFN